MKLSNIIIASLLCLASGYPMLAQDWKAHGVDALFSIARKEAFDGNRLQGQEKLKYILEGNPNYHDVRIFLARTHSWDGVYEEARKELRIVLMQHLTHRDALDALIDVELWSDHNEAALEVTETALRAYPNNEGFLFKRATAFNALNRNKEALLCLHTLLQINPSHEKGIVLYNAINVRGLKYVARILYGTDFFSKDFEPAHYISAQLSRTNAWGSSHIRVNHSQRFNTHGAQFEVDLYPKVANGIYAYINYGYSGSILFPEHRMGADMFFKLPKNFESSAGIRYMDFNRDTKSLIYTASVGWYLKNYWLSIRPYITPNRGAEASASATISVRRYFKDAETYVGINAGMGFSPDLRTIQSGTALTENEIFLLKSQRSGLMWQSGFKKTWIVNLSIDVARQELATVQGQYMIITNVCASVRKKL